MTETRERPAREVRIDRYEPKTFEPKWRERWEAEQIYKTFEDPSKPKFYCLDFFPYPSGDGLSVGHVRNYVPTDVISRYYRMRGYNVLHPMGWDAFGLPAENHAIQTGIHPAQTVKNNTDTYRRQLRMVGTSYDWSREINSSSPDYYKWTQWFFLLLYKRGLAYRAIQPAWWCPKDATVLANEEVEGGLCWRCGTEVVKKDMPQWFFKITDYADRLIEDLDLIDWPERIKTMQRNWIGRSEGAEFEMRVQGREGLSFRVFTTRPDTSFGMTFAVLAPEHPLVPEITTPDRQDEVKAFVERVSRVSEIERLSTEGDIKSRGVFTGAYAINPFNQRPVPIFLADYVLATYGTGAIMAVPGEDQRDWDFAKAYGLPIIRTVQPPEGWEGEAYTGDGPKINSDWLDGTPTVAEAIEKAIAWLVDQGIGERTINYRLRDWLISRQRYWGAPIPIVHCARCGEVPVPEDQLPVRLPDIENYAPSGTGRSPLANVPEFVNTTCPNCEGPAERETDTMGGFACSSWYFLRFTSPHEDSYPFDPQAMRYWMPVDLYVGGAEHAVMHLLYARFWTKVMYDAGIVPFKEPFQKLMNQGVVHAPDGLRMSKSKGNVITPDSVVERFSADALRGYELFMAPFEQNVNWSEEGVRGIHRWLNRVWQLVLDEPDYGDPGAEAVREMRRWTHRTIRKATEDIERLHFNTMISALMEYTNFLQAAREAGPVQREAWDEAIDAMLRMLAPPVPYIAEELWMRRGGAFSVHQQSWPSYDDALAAADTFTLVVQVNGRLRDRFEVPVDISEEAAKEMALASPRVRAHTEGKELVRVLYVPGRLVNIVVR
ncbi:MAG TPA: leucine--tRNA ligase [Dehalococcoidia bacterium]|nr:leucine--tRNA ligase [Dehalococcoidia bacterium]